MKKTKRYIDKLTDLNAKKNIIEEEDKDSISDVEERSVIFKNKEKNATEATNKEIFENIKTEEIYTESERSEEEEEELKFNLSIFDLFEEVPIRGDGNCMFRALALGGFGCENSYPLIREMIWDFIHTNSERFIPFITDGDLDNYLKNKRKNKTWGDHIELIAFSELFNWTISVYDLETDLSPHYSFENMCAERKIILKYRNNDHYNLLIKKNDTLNQASIPKITKIEMKNKENTRKIENKRDMDFLNEEEIVLAEKKYQAIFEYLLSDEKTPKYPSKLFTFPKDKIKDKKKYSSKR